MVCGDGGAPFVLGTGVRAGAGRPRCGGRDRNQVMRLKKVWPAVIAVLGVAGLAGVLVVMFTPLVERLARWLAGQDWSSMDAAARSAAVGQVRLAVVQVVAAVGAGIALIYTARSYRLSRRGQVTDRFTKALERLGSAEPYVCIGGVLALEQIVQDAPDQEGMPRGC